MENIAVSAMENIAVKSPVLPHMLYGDQHSEVRFYLLTPSLVIITEIWICNLI